MQIRSTGDGSLARAGVAINLPEENILTDRGRFATALTQAFASRSIANRSQADLVADYALSTNEAGGGIAANSEEAPSQGSQSQESQSQEPNWIVAPRDKQRFDRCGAKRMLATLILFSRSTGTMVYRGQAAKIECKFDDSDITQMADRLVSDALKAPAN